MDRIPILTRFVIEKLISLRNSMVTQVVDWSRKWPKVWPSVCFVLCVVGLVCLALSTCFICLIEKWIWWKVLLYSIVSLLVILVVVWLTKPSPSDSPISREKASASAPSLSQTVSIVSVLVVTLVYTHFVEKKVDVEPDAYIFVSYAAFSIMSLFLSTLSHYGFEVELFYFLIGILTLQFMKIKWWLVIVGGGIMFFLEHLRSTLDASLTSESGVQQEQNHVPKSQVTSIRNEDKVGLLTAGAGAGASSSQGAAANEEGFSGYIKTLKNENNRVADKVFQYVNSGSTNLVNKNLVVDSMQLQLQLQLEDLHKCAQLMIKEGSEKECLEEYTSWRREFLNIILSLFQSPPDLKMEDIENEEKIQGWVETFAVAMRILFPNEMTLCLHVFRYTNLWDSVFTDVCKELATRLIVSSYAVATWSHFIPNTTLQQLLQELDTMFRLFPGELSSFITNQVYQVRITLAIFEHLKTDLTNHDSGMDTDADGIHSITRKVMNYIGDEFRNNHGSLLGRCFEEYVTAAKEGKHSPSALVERIINLLENSLEATSKSYKTPSLGYVFIMINRTFIARKIERLGLEPIIGHDWLKGNQDNIEQNLQLYLSSSWDETLNFLNEDIDDEITGSRDHQRELMEDNLSSFNQHFEGICNDKSMWFVSDDELRRQIIKSIENILLPAYKKFIMRYQELFHIDYYMNMVDPALQGVEGRLSKLLRGRAGESDDAPKEEKKNV